MTAKRRRTGIARRSRRSDELSRDHATPGPTSATCNLHRPSGRQHLPPREGRGEHRTDLRREALGACRSRDYPAPDLLEGRRLTMCTFETPIRDGILAALAARLARATLLALGMA